MSLTLPVHSRLSLIVLATALGVCSAVVHAKDYYFEFLDKPQPGFEKVSVATAYDAKQGFGYLDSGAASGKPRTFLVDVPEGNYDVTIRFGDPTVPTSTTIKAESNRLMLSEVQTAAGQYETRTFTVNVRRPEIAGGGAVSLKDPEKGPPLVADWDEHLSLEFNGQHPSVASVQIKAVDDALTVFIAGDSTVTDQPHEPYSSWGQMLPRFFGQDVAVSNQSWSGLTLGTFEKQKRLDKILSMMKKGDYMLVQFGHNDQKEKTGGAFAAYKTNLKHYVETIRAKGGIPVIVTPMERRRWQGNQFQPTLADYAEAGRQAGAETSAPVIDLNALSVKFYTALGPDGTKKAFAYYPAGSYGRKDAGKDDTHHSKYGGYELARCVVEEIKAKVPDLATHLAGDAGSFDPSHPDDPANITPPDSAFAGPAEKPAGS